MFTKNLILAASLSAILFSNSANAVIGPIKITLNPTEISSNYFNGDDVSAPFASEIYTLDDIKNSKSNNIYDFLTQNTSLSLAPSSGNRFSQKISARGYGLTVGSANLVITVNGRRLNNIDMSGSQINTININDIEKIEITKGSGSIVYGDSAMAGVINIFTKKNLNNKISTSIGNNGFMQTSASAGVSGEKIDLNMSINNLKHDGYSVADPQGNKDKGEQTKSNINVRYVTDGGTEFELAYDTNELENRYPNAISQAQFDANPAQNSLGRVYTISEKESDTLTYKVKRELVDNLTLSRSSSIFNKSVKTTAHDQYGAGIAYYGKPSRYNYDYRSADYILTYKDNNLKIDGGYSSFDGAREQPTAPNSWDILNPSTKNNKGLFTRAQYSQNDTTYSVGARLEKIYYEYKRTTTGVKLTSKHNEEAYDIGFNTKLNPKTTIFSNYNQAFQAPLVDRFFSSNGTFNEFISPSSSKTINLGLNHLTDKSKTKVTLYRSNIKNEIYLNSAFKNTNLDESHKQGLELQYLFKVTPKWSTNVNYAYTDAIIDKEADDAGALNGKTNPMTSKHNISASVIYSISDKANMTLTQKYRSDAFNEMDYINTGIRKQMAYNSTDFNFSYKANDLEFNFDVENLFDNSYGTVLSDTGVDGYFTGTNLGAIYPGNFTRNIKLGLSYKF